MKLKSPKIYKNKATKYHPSIEITSNAKIWKNMPVTHKPTKKKRYIELKDNINPNDKQRKSYVQKNVREDPIRTRGQLLKKYHLSNEDLHQIEEFLKNKKC